MIDAPESLVISEEEYLVLLDRASEGGTELILIERQSPAANRLEESDGIQIRIAQELPELAVKLVSAALDAGVDHRAGCVPELRAVVIGFHLVHLERIRIRLDDLIRKSLVAGSVSVVVHAVEHEIVQFASAAVDVERPI